MDKSIFGVPEENIHFDDSLPIGAFIIFSDLNEFWDNCPIFYETEQATGITIGLDVDDSLPWPVS